MANTTDQYIAAFPDDVQARLNSIRAIIRKSAPEATEIFGYGMPGYKIHGRALVYFAGYKSHIGFYATPSGHRQFAKALAKYKQGKGSVQFPLDKPLPLALIATMVKFRVRENLAKAKKAVAAKSKTGQTK